MPSQLYPHLAALHVSEIPAVFHEDRFMPWYRKNFQFHQRPFWDEARELAMAGQLQGLKASAQSLQEAHRYGRALRQANPDYNPLLKEELQQRSLEEQSAVDNTLVALDKMDRAKGLPARNR